MKKIIILCLGLLFLISCKSEGNSKKNKETDSNLMNTPVLKVVQGKVVDNKRKAVAYAAVKLYLDENDCMSAYTDENGLFKLKVDELRIKDQSHFEVVYKGYAVNMLSLRNFTEDKPIVLSKKGKTISVVDYRIFYEDIKKCKNN